MFVAKQWGQRASNISEWMALALGAEYRTTGKQLTRHRFCR
jgi:hypothetical protein